MKKTLSGLLGGGLALILLMQACGPDPVEPPPPRPDGGAWAECEDQDAGACAPGEHCRYVDVYERYLCVRPCDAALACEDLALECCGGSEDGGTGGFCLPKEECEQLDAGTWEPDGGEPLPDGGTETDAGSVVDAGTWPDAGPVVDAGTWPDAGPSVDAGTGVPDAGFPGDAGTWPDAGPSVDAGTGVPDAGPSVDAGVPDAGPSVDAGTGVPDAGPGDPDAGTPSPTRIRIMASNLTSGNKQSYLDHGTRLMQGVKPDIVLIQEFKLESGTIPEYVASTFGSSFYYYREHLGGDSIPNGIISRWPIIAAGEWADSYVSDRDYAWARIDIPGPKDLWAVSVHLWGNGGEGGRNNEAKQLVNYINANVPPGDYLIIGGDFNTDNRSEDCLTTFSQVVSTVAPHPADQNNNLNTNANRNKPYDQVLVDGDLRPFQTATVIGASTYPNGLVLDSRVYTPLSEIAPVQYGDSAASNMQHMGVVKDFLVPAY